MRNARFLVLVLLACAVLTPRAAAQGCVVQGITTMDFGTGCGFGSPPELKLGYDPASCELVVDVAAFGCCNFFPSGHILAYGQMLGRPELLPSPPFFAGCEQLIRVRDQTAEQPGLSSRHPVPQNVNLVGRTLDFQAAVRWFDTISFVSEYGVTQGVRATFF